MKLGKREIDALECPPGRRDRLVFDDDMPGLCLRVTPTGSKLFLFQYREKGTGPVRRLRLGAYGDITPAQARKLAQEARGRVAGGNDPVADRQKAQAEAEAARQAAKTAAEAEALTLRALIERWAEIGLQHASPAHRKEAPRAIELAGGRHLALPAHQLTIDHAQQLIDRIAKTRPMMSRRTRDYARAMFNWAMGRRLVPGNPFVAVTVEARETSRDRVLSDAELAEAWNAAGTLGYPFGPFIRLLILTLQRRGEVAGMRWDELAPDLSTWTIPGHRTKNDKAHIVHLAPAARTVLRQVKRTKGAQLVFTTTGDTPISAFTRARARLAEAIDEARALSAEAAGTKPPPKRAKKPDRGWTLHDLRRTGVTKLAALGIPPYVADRVLNHVQGTIRGVAAVYQRHEFLAERLAAIETWAEFVLQNAAGAEAPPKSPQSAKKQQTKRKITPAN